MERVATFLWRTPPPTSVDEELALFDEGTALLVVRHGRQAAPSIGTWRAGPEGDDLATLLAAGPGPVVFDLLAPPADDALLRAADRVAASARDTPLAVAGFFGQALPAAGGPDRPAVLQVLASGTEAVGFELDPGSLQAHYLDGGRTLSWQPLPPPEIGFMTPEAEGLGGLRSPAEVSPGRYGAVRLALAPPPGATSFVIRLGGWLRRALPDHPMPEPFEVRTDPADL
ncbi:MAG TPA: hypothetical protein VFJ85_05325 [Acidimicrobiales bacterium]|nr:hypothetical protein [Acidimicrobiales bacterium]